MGDGWGMGWWWVGAPYTCAHACACLYDIIGNSQDSFNGGCCDTDQNDTIGKIELNPSCQVKVLTPGMTFNSFSHCLMSRSQWRLPLTPPGVRCEANSGMTIHTLVLTVDSFSCNCNSID